MPARVRQAFVLFVLTTLSCRGYGRRAGSTRFGGGADRGTGLGNRVPPLHVEEVARFRIGAAATLGAAEVLTAMAVYGW